MDRPPVPVILLHVHATRRRLGLTTVALEPQPAPASLFQFFDLQMLCHTLTIRLRPLESLSVSWSSVIAHEGPGLVCQGFRPLVIRGSLEGLRAARTP